VRPVIVIGDSLLDRTVSGQMDRLTPEGCPLVEEGAATERPGGAALAAAAIAADGSPTILVTAIGRDAAGRRLHQLLWQAGVRVADLGLDGPTPEKWRIRAGDRTVVRLDRSCTPVPPVGCWTSEAAEALSRAAAILVSDYGRGMTGMAAARSAIAQRAPDVPVVWDPHRRGGEVVEGVDMVTPNLDEARHLLDRASPIATLEEVIEAGRRLTGRLRSAMAVTMGERGAVLAEVDGSPMVVPARPRLGDTCGAGDRFAARLTHERAQGTDRPAAVTAAVAAAGHFVATGHLGPAEDTERDAAALAAELRRTGRRVVVAGGCFDLLHTGHVSFLEAARALGDGLIVCLNSDRSVRALKGPRRPLVGQDDRRRVLEALACVDAVHVFDELTPCEALRTLRPHLFCKGADYRQAELPEESVLSEWGGQAVLLPYVAGHSSSELIEMARVS
jgi:D-beta-D-heptose 7-phosphate kinase / D-beta-D-heptose 1-phosphate adenosyltransferase